MIARAILAALLMLASLQSAYAGDEEDFATPDASRPAVGEWIGNVSWNDSAYVTYVWSIFSDGTFNSGRVGRGSSGVGDGSWGLHGDLLVLKYTNGLRYEGQLREDTYSGQAILVDGSVFGAFSMSRAHKNAVIEESP